jgi:exopolyphosphatase/guanosine-5'-triphosphate,3'-diphosphate pyrophosphatase
MIVAALDLGSNSFLCLLAKSDSENNFSTISDHVEIVRLGKNLEQKGEFDSESLQRAQNTLERFKKQIETVKPDLVLAVATAAARRAKNSEELIKIGQKLSIPIEIISGS